MFSLVLSSGVEVRTALGPAHGKGREGVFEGLLEGKELHYTEVHAGMETEAALIGADGTVHLHAETAVDLDFSTVVGPGNAEHDHPFGFRYPLHDFEIQKMGI